jgi:hypothetical protein
LVFIKFPRGAAAAIFGVGKGFILRGPKNLSTFIKRHYLGDFGKEIIARIADFSNQRFVPTLKFHSIPK